MGLLDDENAFVRNAQVGLKLTIASFLEAVFTQEELKASLDQLVSA